jgi:hypothetical protein
VAGTQVLTIPAVSVFPFSSAADLDFTGRFLYAINVGGVGTTQSGIEFTSDDVDGVSIKQTNAPHSQGAYDFGDDDGLEDVLQSLRWSTYPKPIIVELERLEVGTKYKLQMFFSERWNTRGFDIQIDNETILENFVSEDVEGGINVFTTGACVAVLFTASLSTMVITLAGNGGYPDNNPLLSGFTLVETPGATLFDISIYQMTFAVALSLSLLILCQLSATTVKDIARVLDLK